MDEYAPQKWLPHERPLLPGSPSTPLHSAPKRLAFLLVGLIVALTGGLGNALVTVNLVYAQGSLGVTSADIQWLPAAYACGTLAWMALHYAWQVCTASRPAAPAQNAQTGMAQVSLSNSGGQ